MCARLSYACPGPFANDAIHRFLLEAEASSLWGFDIAHANQIGKGNASDPAGIYMLPHCFDLLWRWNVRTSNVFRDWLMLMLRRGIASNDQEPLALAEARQLAAGGLSVGQLPTEFAAAFYSAYQNATFWPRISRRLHGPAFLVHGTPLQSAAPYSQYLKPNVSGSEYDGKNGAAYCAAFNAAVDQPRQLLERRLRGGFETLHSDSECTARLGLPSGACPYTAGAMRNLSAPILRSRLFHLQLAEKRAKWHRRFTSVGSSDAVEAPTVGRVRVRPRRRQERLQKLEKRMHRIHSFIHSFMPGAGRGQGQ